MGRKATTLPPSTGWAVPRVGGQQLANVRLHPLCQPQRRLPQSGSRQPADAHSTSGGRRSTDKLPPPPRSRRVSHHTAAKCRQWWPDPTQATAAARLSLSRHSLPTTPSALGLGSNTRFGRKNKSLTRRSACGPKRSRHGLRGTGRGNPSWRVVFLLLPAAVAPTGDIANEGGARRGRQQDGVLGRQAGMYCMYGARRAVCKCTWQRYRRCVFGMCSAEWSTELCAHSTDPPALLPPPRQARKQGWPAGSCSLPYYAGTDQPSAFQRRCPPACVVRRFEPALDSLALRASRRSTANRPMCLLQAPSARIYCLWARCLCPEHGQPSPLGCPRACNSLWCCFSSGQSRTASPKTAAFKIMASPHALCRGYTYGLHHLARYVMYIRSTAGRHNLLISWQCMLRQSATRPPLLRLQPRRPDRQ